MSMLGIVYPSACWKSSVRSMRVPIRVYRSSKLHIVSTSSEAGFSVPGVPHDVAQFACNWETDSENLIMPKPVLERLVNACLTMS